jgi:hypothetical protein
LAPDPAAFPAPHPPLVALAAPAAWAGARPVASREPEGLGRVREALARTALRDHVGGGFFAGASPGGAFSFEKRLAPNAVLLRAFARGYARSGSPLDRDVARETVAWAVRELRDASGAFWSGIYGATAGASGAYYLWSAAEIRDALGPERSAELERTFTLVPPGVLVLAGSPFAGLGASQQVLLGRRARRVRPATDSRVFADANGLMIGALAASGASGWGADLELARRAAAAVLERLGPADRLQRCGRADEPCRPAELTDHAFLAEGLLDLHEATSEKRWRDDTVGVVDAAVSRFWDTERGGFHETDVRAEARLLRPKSARDGPGSRCPSRPAAATRRPGSRGSTARRRRASCSSGRRRDRR